MAFEIGVSFFRRPKICLIRFHRQFFPHQHYEPEWRKMHPNEHINQKPQNATMQKSYFYESNQKNSKCTNFHWNIIQYTRRSLIWPLIWRLQTNAPMRWNGWLNVVSSVVGHFSKTPKLLVVCSSLFPQRMAYKNDDPSTWWGIVRAALSLYRGQYFKLEENKEGWWGKFNKTSKCEVGQAKNITSRCKMQRILSIIFRMFGPTAVWPIFWRFSFSNSEVASDLGRLKTLKKSGKISDF